MNDQRDEFPMKMEKNVFARVTVKENGMEIDGIYFQEKN